MKIIFIGGNAHSGTTIFEQLLSREMNVLALGEIYYSYQVFIRKEIEHYTCSCNYQSDCIWTSIKNNWTKSKIKTYSEAYRILLDTVQEVYPEVEVISDSSKYPQAFQEIIIHQPEFILVSKNPRSWMNSALRRRLQKKGEDVNWFQKMKIRFRLLRSWTRINQVFLSNPQVNVVLYETLVFEPTQTLNFLKSKLHFLENRPSVSDHFVHQLIGNKIRHKSYQIKYDTRWIWAKDPLLDALILMPFVQRTWQNLNEIVLKSQESNHEQ